MKIENISQIAKKLGKQERAWEKPATLAKIVKVWSAQKRVRANSISDKNDVNKDKQR